mgnify:CR=1 FL=1
MYEHREALAEKGNQSADSTVWTRFLIDVQLLFVILCEC